VKERKKSLKYGGGMFYAKAYELVSGMKRKYWAKLGLLFYHHYKQK
jgi:hypothetical protein